MPRHRLTDANVRSLRPPPKPRQVEYFDTLLPSLAVRVSYAGQKTFVLHDRVGGGRVKRLRLGTYPAMSLSEARRKARDWKIDAKRGLDPVAQHARREAAAIANSFGAAVDRFLAANNNRLRDRTRAEYARVLKGPDFSAWMQRPLRSITRADVGAALDRISNRAPSAGNHALAYLKALFNWCADRDLIEHPPTDRVRPRHAKGKRERHLANEEIAVVLGALDPAAAVMHGIDPESLPTLTQLFRDFAMLLLLTGQRRQEVAGMRWDELRDLKGAEPRWEIPSARTKNHREHIVPLSPAAVSILRSREASVDNSPFVFSGTGSSPLSGFGHAKAALDKRLAAVCAAAGRPTLPHWTWHDLRRTMVTVMNEQLGIPPHIVEAVVNHVSGAAKAGVAGVYNRALYLKERREALNRWAGFLERLQGPR